VQELGGAKVKADGGVLAGGAGEPNGPRLRRTLLTPMGKCSEKEQLIFYTPTDTQKDNFLPFLV